MNASKLVEVEDIYRPYKEKKKTKATEAIKNGLEPLAKIIMSFKDIDVKKISVLKVGMKICAIILVEDIFRIQVSSSELE